MLKEDVGQQRDGLRVWGLTDASKLYSTGNCIQYLVINHN